MSDTNFELNDDTVKTDAVGANVRVFGAESSAATRASSYGRDALYKTARAALADDAGTSRTNLGLATGDSPQFTGINLGHASDTTLTRSAAGRIAVEGVSIPLASDLIKSALSVSGMDNTGATSCNTALATLISTGGAWYFPDGDYLITGSGVDARRSKNLYILCSPRARFFSPTGASAVEGDLFNWAVPSGGVGLPANGLITVWQGGFLDVQNVKNSTSMPFIGVYPAANPGTLATGEAFSFRDEYTSGTIKNGSDRIEVRNVTFYHADHWEDAGGDSSIFANSYNLLIVEGCTFIGARDQGVYASGDATATTYGRTRIVGNRFVNCFFGAAVKRALRGFEISNNTFKNCVGGVNVNEIIGTPTSDGVVTGNFFEDCGVWVRIDYGRRVTVRDNTGRSFGATDASGAAVTVYNPNVFVFNGATHCTIENNRCEGRSSTFSATNVYLLDIQDFTTATASVVKSEYNSFRRNVGIDIYGVGTEVSGEADNNDFDQNYVVGGTVANVVKNGASSTVVRYDATNARRVFETPVGFGDGSAATPTLQRLGQTNVGLFFGTNKVGFTTSGTERVAVTSDGLEFGATTDATLARSGAGDLSIEGNVIHRVGGTDVAVADGGTGSSTARGAAANLGTWFVVAQSGVQVARNSVNGAGDATEATLVTVTIPAGAMGPNGSIRWRVQWSYTNSVNAKTLRTRFGGAAGTIYQSTSVTTTVGYVEQRQIWNRNSASSQVGSANAMGGGIGTTTGSIATSSIDTTAAVDLVFRCNWAGATSGETIAIEGYCVEVCYGA